MEHSNETSTETPSLLILNDYCLMDIFKLLNLIDYTNLALTCTRLRSIAKNVSAQIHKVIVLSESGRDVVKSKNEFAKILSVIGEHVLEIEVFQYSTLFQIARENCKNVNSITLWGTTLWGTNGNLQLQNFKQLKHLSGANLSSSVFKKYVSSVPEIESLEYMSSNYEDEDILKSLAQLKNLKHLSLSSRSYLLHNQFLHLLRLNGLTKLSFRTMKNCNKLLIELPKKMNLLELDVNMPINTHTFHIMKSFNTLEVLSLENSGTETWIPENAVFPSKLKRIKLRHTKISCGAFISIIKSLQCLEEIDIQASFRSGIYWYFEKSDENYRWFKDSDMIYRIVDQLKAEIIQRTLKIMYYEWVAKGASPCLYNSNHLQIVNSYVTDKYDWAYSNIIQFEGSSISSSN